MELSSLLIFVVQQMGVVLGAGAEVVVLFAYLASLRAREPDFAHQTFVRVARHAQASGLWLMVISGAAAVASHALGGTLATVGEPSFIAKWLLLFALAACFVEEGRAAHRDTAWLRGYTGATWLALFLLHTVAPRATWAALGLLYGLILLFAMIAWYGSVLLLRHAKRVIRKTDLAAPLAPAAPASVKLPPSSPPPPLPSVALAKEGPPPPPVAPKPPPAPPPAPKPAAPQPPPLPSVALAKEGPPKPAAMPPAPPPAAPPKPAPAYDDAPDLPAIRVMPKRPEDIARQFRGGAVELE